jgi:hypothetical protein
MSHGRAGRGHTPAGVHGWPTLTVGHDGGGRGDRDRRPRKKTSIDMANLHFQWKVASAEWLTEPDATVNRPRAR